LASVADVARPAAASRGLHLSTVVGPGISSLSTDPTRLRQVLSNLLSNACKFTLSGSVVLEVRAEGPHQIRFTVTDTGIGIAENQLAAIFDEFIQVDTSSTRAYGGTGLGLAISRKLCRKMGGDVTVTSQLGVGSVFEVRLPLR
jgi:adenylate cyclase